MIKNEVSLYNMVESFLTIFHLEAIIITLHYWFSLVGPFCLQKTNQNSLRKCCWEKYKGKSWKRKLG